jgi:hypothetical protein
MPRMDSAIYAAHMDSVLKLARREGGVTRPQIMEELNVTRAVAAGLIEKSGLKLDRRVGRTEFFTSDGTTPAPAPTPPPKTEAKQSVSATKVATPVSDAVAPVDDDELAELDAQIIDTRNAMREAAEKAGKFLGEWATHQAMVDALRQRMTELCTRRMRGG